MAHRNIRYFRAQRDIDAMYFQIMRDAVKRSREILAKPVPSLFVGNKTREPFPTEAEAGRMQWAAKESPPSKK